MIGREELVILETLARQQARIYADACDIGIWETPEIRKQIRESLAGLKELEGGKAYRWTTGCSYETRLAVEMDEGMVQGYRIKVSRNENRYGENRGRAFYTIEIGRTSWEPADYSLASTH